MNKSEIQLIFKELNISPKKSKGQNFLFDNNIRDKLIATSGITNEDIILEVGPGLGFLTEALLEHAKKVIAIEIDPILFHYLTKKFEGKDNIKLINNNVLDVELPFHNKVVSNLPFSATGPIIEKLLFRNKPPEATFITEIKIAQRIFSKNNYKTRSRITISTNSFMNPIEISKISRNCFYPVPNVDLSLIKLMPRENINPFLLEDETRSFFLKFIAGVMPYKNKNIVNAIKLFLKSFDGSNLGKERIFDVLHGTNYENKKVFTLNITEFIELSNTIYKTIIDIKEG